jgi:hypothetical protein
MIHNDPIFTKVSKIREPDLMIEFLHFSSVDNIQYSSYHDDEEQCFSILPISVS